VAGRKKSKKDFRNDPFRRLRGFAVSEEKKEDYSTEDARKPPEPPPAEEENVRFSEAMAQLGVTSMGEEPSGDENPANTEAEGAPAERCSPTQKDEELFLSALKGMDTVFRDEMPSSERAPAAPRRMKLVRQGRLVPEDQLDLHGLTREEALEKVRFFLEDALYHGHRTVLVITGMGKGSGGEPVLRTEVEGFLNGAGRRWVSEWGRAPRRLGGEGALVVFLRGKQQ